MAPRPLALNSIVTGDSTKKLDLVDPESVSLSFWSPPYYVGKEYEKDLTFESWQALLATVIAKHAVVLKPGGFLAINIADILAFPDPDMPRIQASTPNMRKAKVTREEVLAAKAANPDFNRYQLAELLGVSEQTIQRRVEGNNIRGGKREPQTRVFAVGGLVQQWASDAGLYLYDRRVWHKDPCWANSQWHSLSYRSVDEFEYVYIFWKPGVTEVKRDRLDRQEWSDWGSRAVWQLASVRANDIHEAQFPMELARRVIRLLSDPGDTVLDPFMGSGTTALAAQELGRNFIGIERDATYARLARKRVKAAAAQLMRDTEATQEVAMQSSGSRDE